MRILIGIPAYNEEKMVGRVVKSIKANKPEKGNTDILVVDDGSSDDTASVAKKNGAMVLSHILNRGLGGAIGTIFKYAKVSDYDLLVTFDADGQHNPRDLKKIISPILSRKADVVIGTRWKKAGRVPFSRKTINFLANLVTFFFYGIYTSDSQSGLRAFSRKAIERIDIQTEGMEVSSEIFQNIVRNKMKFTEVAVDPIYTPYSLGKGQPISNAANVGVKLLLRLMR